MQINHLELGLKSTKPKGRESFSDNICTLIKVWHMNGTIRSLPTKFSWTKNRSNTIWHSQCEKLVRWIWNKFLTACDLWTICYSSNFVNYLILIIYSLYSNECFHLIDLISKGPIKVHNFMSLFFIRNWIFFWHFSTHWIEINTEPWLSFNISYPEKPVPFLVELFLSRDPTINILMWWKF